MHRADFLQWAVLQYCIFRPLISLAGIITEKYNVLCKHTSFMTWRGGIFWQVHTGPGQFSIHFAAVYLDSVEYVLTQSLFPTQHWWMSSFVSFSIALYALVVFYALTKENLEGKQPLAKFLSIKLIVFFTFCECRQFATVFFWGSPHKKTKDFCSVSYKVMVPSRVQPTGLRQTSPMVCKHCVHVLRYTTFVTPHYAYRLFHKI